MLEIKPTKTVYVYYCDGGISPKLSPDPCHPCYGSYRKCIQYFTESGLISKQWGEEIWMVHKNNIHTSNMSEFATLIEVLKIVKEDHLPTDEVVVIMDSKMVLESLAGNYKVKNKNIVGLFQQAKTIVDSCLCKLSFTWISGREMKTILTH